MATSEIEKLERRYAENPQGLTFAPLAEIHRKSGDLTRALELLRAGLELHPNYIPASIVLGRCHWDLGDLPAAESAFAHVLRLDDENVIALKSLADINERLERFTEAQRWLQRLVSVDRSNEEARQQLARLETGKARGDRKAENAPAPSATTELPREITAPEPVQVEAKAPVIPSVPPSAAAPPERATSEMAPLDLTADIAEAASPPPSGPPVPETVGTKSPGLEFLDTSESARAEIGTSASAASSEEPAPVDGLISQEFVPPKEATYRLHPELTREFVPSRELPDRLDVETTEDVELTSSGAAEFRVPNAAEDFMELAGPPPSDRKDTAAARAAPPSSGGLESVTHTDPASGGQSYSFRDTKGQSVAAFFKALLAARPSGNSSHSASHGSAPAEDSTPTPPAQDILSLSSVLGKEEPTNSPEIAVPGQTKDAVVSFDDFFGSSAGGASALPGGSSEPSNDDLDQFQSWLQNLKR